MVLAGDDVGSLDVQNQVCTLRIQLRINAQSVAVNYWKGLVVFGGRGCDNRVRSD